MKKMKLLTSMFLSLIMVLSMAVSPVWAATQYDGSGNAPMNGTTMIANILPGFAGKDTADKVYSLTGAAADAGSGNTGFNIAKSTTSNTDTATLEFQFLLPTTTDKLKVSIHYFYKSDKSVNTTNSFNITTSGLADYNNKISSISSLKTVSLDTNKWYTISLAIPGDGGKTIPVYINGTNVATINVNGSYPVYGIRSRALVGPAASTQMVYIDDVYSYKASEKTFSQAESTPSNLTTTLSNYTLSDDTLTVPHGATFADLKSAITTTDAAEGTDVVRYYTDSTMTAEITEDSASVDGATIVVAAKNGTDVEQAYSYYSVKQAEPDPDVLKGKSADDLVGSTLAFASVAGMHGKLADDTVYQISSDGDTNRLTLANTLTKKLTGTSVNTFTKNEITAVSFSFMIPSGSNGFSINDTTYWSTSGSNKRGNFNRIVFDTDGIWSGDKVSKLEDIEADKWYNFTLSCSSDGGKDVELYLNGVSISKTVAEYDMQGFRTMNLDMRGNSVYYLDNIEAEASTVISDDAAATVTGDYISAYGGKLNLLAGKTDFETNGTCRLYKDNWVLTDDITEAEIAVFAATNGRSMERTLTYYDVNLSDCVVGYDVTTADETKTLNASIYSNTQASLILAHYTVEGGVKTFEGVTSIDATFDDGVYVAAIPASVLNSAYSYTLFAWSDTDNTITPLTTSINLN